MLRSIKQKLIAFNLITFSVLMTLAGAFLYLTTAESVLGSIDSHLYSEVQLIAALFEEEGGYFEVELSEANVGEFSSPLSGHYYQVFSGNGDLVARSPSLSIPNAFLPEQEDSLEASYTVIVGPGKKKLRMISQVFNSSLGILKIEAAEPMEGADALLHTFLMNTLFIIVGTSLFSIPCIWGLTGASLKKLESLSKKVSEVTEKNLNESIECTRLDKELMPLAQSFNGLLFRLGGAFSKQRDFLSNASHDLRTPVSVMKATCEVTLGRKRSPSEYRESLQRILKSSQEMALTIDKILIASRLDSDNFSLEKSRVDLNSLASEVVLFLEPQASVQGVTLSHCTGRPVLIDSDVGMVREVILNIVENGIKYNRDGGRVDVEVKRIDGGAVVQVSDTGIGIDDRELENIFLRYYRVTLNEKREKGCGLGLSIALDFMKKCGGTIEVESTLGKGTKFQVVFVDSAGSRDRV
ncbi:MAG: sensor histidine kinase [Nitrospinota bacterium]